MIILSPGDAGQPPFGLSPLVVQAMITGFCALIGALLGSILLTRRQRMNWLFQKKAEAFADLIQSLNAARREILESKLLALPKDKSFRQRKEQILSTIVASEGIARIYASKRGRKLIGHQIRSLTGGYATVGESEESLMFGLHLLDLQEIFEEEIDERGWFYLWRKEVWRRIRNAWHLHKVRKSNKVQAAKQENFDG